MKKNSVNSFPVSRKFYEGLRDRVRSIVISVIGVEDTDIIKQVLIYIDDYIKAPSKDYTLWVRGYRAPEIIFYSLRGEIDSALERSRRARARAAARRAASTAIEILDTNVSRQANGMVASNPDAFEYADRVECDHKTSSVKSNRRAIHAKNKSSSGVHRE